MLLFDNTGDTDFINSMLKMLVLIGVCTKTILTLLGRICSIFLKISLKLDQEILFTTAAAPTSQTTLLMRSMLMP